MAHRSRPTPGRSRSRCRPVAGYKAAIESRFRMQVGFFSLGTFRSEVTTPWIGT